MTWVSPSKWSTCFHQSASTRHQGELSAANGETNTVHPGCNVLEIRKLRRVANDTLLALNIVSADLGFVERGKLFFSAVEELAVVPSVAAPGGVIVPTNSPRLGCNRAIHVTSDILQNHRRVLEDPKQRSKQVCTLDSVKWQ